MKHSISYLLCILLVTACAKDSFTAVNIKGILLVSSSNPVPVPDYILTFCESKNSGQLDSNLTGGTFFIDPVTTSSSGYFEGQLAMNKNASKQGVNPTGALGYKNPEPHIDWRNLSFSDQDLGTVYLYKKVTRAIITLSTTAGISPSDTLFTTVNTIDGYREKAITNLSLPAGTFAYNLDTVSNLIFTRYSISTHQYYNDITIRKSGAANQFTVTSNETQGDEAEKVYAIAIP